VRIAHESTTRRILIFVSRRSFISQSSLLLGASLLPSVDRLRLPFPAEIYRSLKGSEDHPEIPVLISEDFTRDLEPAYLSNGMIGIRPRANPLIQANTEVSGFVSASYGPYLVEGHCPAPYPLGTDIIVEGISLIQQPDRVSILRQKLDMSTGELITDMTFTPRDGARIDLRVLQFASRSVPALLCQELTITAYTDLRMQVVARIDCEQIAGRVYFEHPAARSDADLTIGFYSPNDYSKLGITVLVSSPESVKRDEQELKKGTATRAFALKAERGHTYRFSIIAAMVSQFYHPAPEMQAYRMAKWGEALGFETLRHDNRNKWKDLWQSRVKVYGDQEAQRVLDAAFFYLFSSVHESNKNGMSPFGLSHFQDYGGHSFWDTETNSFLPILLAAPEIARSLLEFRSRGLDSARKLTDLYGYRGAHFPWEASPIDGSETTPTWAATGWEEQHITPDIAIAFWEYQMATGDSAFLREATWPVLKAIAEWIESRGVHTKRGFEILHVMGSDEGTGKSNNNSYVNITCRMALLAAIRCARLVGVAPPVSWQTIADTIVIPVDRKKQIILPFDNSTEGPTYPQVNLDFLAVHDMPIDIHLLRNTYEYEKKARGTRKLFGSLPVGIGFATAAVAASAAMFGDKAKAAELFHLAWEAIWIEPFGVSREVPWQNYGCFLTNYGGLLQTAMLGFTGLRVGLHDWRKYRASLPQGWSRIEIDRIWINGVPRRLVAEDGVLPQLHHA